MPRMPWRTDIASSVIPLSTRFAASTKAWRGEPLCGSSPCSDSFIDCEAKRSCLIGSFSLPSLGEGFDGEVFIATDYRLSINGQTSKLAMLATTTNELLVDSGQTVHNPNFRVLSGLRVIRPSLKLRLSFLTLEILDFSILQPN